MYLFLIPKKFFPLIRNPGSAPETYMYNDFQFITYIFIFPPSYITKLSQNFTIFEIC